jgi:hypothetical protein
MRREAMAAHGWTNAKAGDAARVSPIRMAVCSIDALGSHDARVGIRTVKLTYTGGVLRQEQGSSRPAHLEIAPGSHDGAQTVHVARASG